MTSNSLTENEEHDILSQIYVWFPALLYGPVIPNCSGQLAELIVYIIPPEWICILQGWGQVKYLYLILGT